MKWLHRGSLIVLLLLLWPLSSCSHKPPATRLDREKWNRATLNGAYDAVGSRNPKWDKDAEDALTHFAETRTASDNEQETLSDLIGYDTDNATDAGCDDPMIRYLHARFSTAARAKTLAERQGLFMDAADKLQGSSYPPIRKFYANVDAAEILWQPRNTNRWPDVSRLRDNSVWNLVQAVQEKSFPEAEAYDAAEALFQMFAHNAGITNAYNQIESELSRQPGKSTMADFIKAAFYVQYAWRARGHGTADQVSEEGWRLFNERLATAEKALNHAWSADPQDPQIPTLMISVVLGQQKGRPEMEKWFARAMAADPDCYRACQAKLNFLLPQWYGSREDMLDFGRECAASTNWGGQVPLILVDAHRDFADTLDSDARRDYWTQRDVWPDLKAAYEKFAKLNPDQTRFRYPYAWYAFRCGQTNDFVEQIKLIRKNDGEVRYSYFGGKELFDRLWSRATGTEPPTNSAAAPPASPGH